MEDIVSAGDAAIGRGADQVKPVEFSEPKQSAEKSEMLIPVRTHFQLIADSVKSLVDKFSE
jgi:hypothetical protein